MTDTYFPQGYALWAAWQSAPGQPWERGPVLGWRAVDDGPIQPVVRSLTAVQEPPATVAVYVLASSRKGADAVFEHMTADLPATPPRRRPRS